MEQNKFKYYSKKITIPNLHNKKTFWILFFLIVVTLTFFRNLAYYETKQVSDSAEITNLAKTIHLNLKKCWGYKNNKDDCIQELKDDLNNNLKPFGIVQLSDKNKILISYDRTKPRHIDRKLVTLPQYLTTFESNDYNLYIAKHSTPNIFITVFRSMTFSIYDLYTRAQKTSLKDAINWYKRDRIFQRSKGTIYFIIITFIVLFFIRKRQQQPKKEDLIYGHNPKALVRLLSNFTRDTPMKYTTHMWDFGSISKEYTDYNGFIHSVKEQWAEIEDELKILSSELHTKIYNFIFASKNENTWIIKDNIAVGWSSLDGFDKWCNKGKDPFDFKLKKSFIVEGKEISKFGDIVNLFKQEIEIRKEYHMLENIFMDIEENMDERFFIETTHLGGKNFYTDVKTFKYILNKIFSEIQKRDFFKIVVEAVDTTGEYIDIKITQIGSTAQMSSKDMLKEVEDGDFGDIGKSLKNLCDWSIESSFEGENYRVNYLRSDKNIVDIESLDYIPEGFTHILRFYKK